MLSVAILFICYSVDESQLVIVISKFSVFNSKFINQFSFILLGFNFIHLLVSDSSMNLLPTD